MRNTASVDSSIQMYSHWMSELKGLLPEISQTDDQINWLDWEESCLLSVSYKRTHMLPSSATGSGLLPCVCICEGMPTVHALGGLVWLIMGTQRCRCRFSICDHSDCTMQCPHLCIREWAQGWIEFKSAFCKCVCVAVCPCVCLHARVSHSASTIWHFLNSCQLQPKCFSWLILKLGQYVPTQNSFAVRGHLGYIAASISTHQSKFCQPLSLTISLLCTQFHVLCVCSGFAIYFISCIRRIFFLLGPFPLLSNGRVLLYEMLAHRRTGHSQGIYACIYIIFDL